MRNAARHPKFTVSDDGKGIVSRAGALLLTTQLWRRDWRTSAGSWAGGGEAGNSWLKPGCYGPSLRCRPDAFRSGDPSADRSAGGRRRISAAVSDQSLVLVEL
jgi:hypothetical protein